MTGTTYDYTAIEGTKTFTFTMVGYTNASKSANVGAGVNARITLTDVSNDLGDTTLTAGGETLTSTGVNSVAFDVKSDVNGVWT